ncbi:hypothetical protein ABPG72_002794, partial [Tetrahymena utriculariae]
QNVYDSLIVSIEDVNLVPQINSVNNYIYIYLTVNVILAKFISYTYGGVLTYLSDKNDWLKIKGDLNSVNLVIQKGIQLANFTSDISSVYVIMTFDDTVNKLITKTIQASNKKIIKLNSPILNNPELTLQQDFEKKFSSRSVYLEDTFSYSFSSSIFINKDDKKIQYEAHYCQKAEERTFVGTTKSSQYGQSVHLLINATDGFTYATASLVFKIDSIPISYLIVLLFQIISPLLDKQAKNKEFDLEKQKSESLFENSNSKLKLQQQIENTDSNNSKFSKQSEQFQSKRFSLTQSPFSIKRSQQKSLRKQTFSNQLKQTVSIENSKNQQVQTNNTLNSSQIIMEIREQYQKNNEIPNKKLVEQLSNPLSMIC